MEFRMNSLKLVLLTATIMLATAFTQSFAQQKGSFTDPRDKKSYKTVAIGEQTWMAENLNHNAKGSKCYANKDANCKKYGRLYGAENAKSVCPAGWHLPTGAEFNKLIDAAGGKETAEKFLKSKSGWNADRDIHGIHGGDGKQMIPGNGEDKLGFAAVPGGAYGGEGACGDGPECEGFDHMGSCGFFISADDDYRLSIYSGEGLSSYSAKDFYPILFSVRCLKD
jgi:uncharacterized protein (TIGR02145 family)